jgi:hypothetical protein
VGDGKREIWNFSGFKEKNIVIGIDDNYFSGSLGLLNDSHKLILINFFQQQV